MTSPTTLPATETWTGADGAPWPSYWTITNGGATLRGNRGDLNINGVTWAGSGAAHPLVAADLDWQVTFSFDRYGDTVGRDSIIYFCSRSSAGPFTVAADGKVEHDHPHKGYTVRFYINPDQDGVGWFIFELYRFDGSGVAPAKASEAYGWPGWFDRRVDPGVDYRVRMRVIGNRVQARYWPLSEPEPTGWNIDWSDPDPLPAGRVWLGTATGWGGATRGFRYDNLLITAPPVVNAGPDQSVKPGQQVNLAATASDADGTATVTWAQTGGPAVTLSGSGVNRSFTAPVTLAGATLEFTATATDSNGAWPVTDTVIVTVAAAPARIWNGTAEVPALLRVV